MQSLNKIVVSLGFVGLIAATGVQAETVRIRESGTATGESVNVHLPLGTQNYFLGNFKIQDASAGSFLVYCIDPYQWASGSFKTYEKSILGLGNFSSNAASRLNNVTELFSYAYAGSLTSADKAAGFQLALWETFNDNMNLDSGIVRETDQTNEVVHDEAESLLSHLQHHAWTAPAASYKLNIYTNPNHQDFINVGAVPEPETFALLMAGLGLVGWRMRRRNQD